MSEVWRMFAAIDLTDEIKERMKRTQQLLEEAGWQCRWVPEHRMHMTVRFYGNLEVSTVEKLQEELRPRLMQQPAFELRVSRVGAFPAPNRPRTIWLGIDDRFQQLEKLRNAVDVASEAVGIEREPGPYRPHLTVARLTPNFKIDGEEAVETFQEFGMYEPLTWIPESMKLIRSKIGRGGSTYTVIEEFPMGEPDGTISSDEDEEEQARPLTLLDFLDNTDPPEPDEIEEPEDTEQRVEEAADPEAVESGSEHSG